MTGRITRRENGTFVLTGTFKVGNSYKHVNAEPKLTDAEKDEIKREFNMERDALIRMYPGKLALHRPLSGGTRLARCDNDADRDAVTNAGDNCASVFNPDQLDQNGNGIGDACEFPDLAYLNIQDRQVLFDGEFVLTQGDFDVAALPFEGNPLPMGGGNVEGLLFSDPVSVGSLTDHNFPPWLTTVLTVPSQVNPQDLQFFADVNGQQPDKLTFVMAPLDTDDGFGVATLGTFGQLDPQEMSTPVRVLEHLGLQYGENTVTTVIEVPGQGPAVTTVSFHIVPEHGQWLICHQPPGNPSNAHTISVGTSALAAHFDHGDVIDGCALGSDPLNETLLELEAQKGLLQKLKKDQAKNVKKLLDDAIKKLDEAIAELKKFQKSGGTSGNEGKIEQAIRDAATAIDNANALLNPKSLTLERIAKTLRDIAANLF